MNKYLSITALGIFASLFATSAFAVCPAGAYGDPSATTNCLMITVVGAPASKSKGIITVNLNYKTIYCRQATYLGHPTKIIKSGQVQNCVIFASDMKPPNGTNPSSFELTYNKNSACKVTINSESTNNALTLDSSEGCSSFQVNKTPSKVFNLGNYTIQPR